MKKSTRMLLKTISTICRCFHFLHFYPNTPVYSKQLKPLQQPVKAGFRVVYTDGTLTFSYSFNISRCSWELRDPWISSNQYLVPYARKRQSETTGSHRSCHCDEIQWVSSAYFLESVVCSALVSVISTFFKDDKV